MIHLDGDWLALRRLSDGVWRYVERYVNAACRAHAYLVEGAAVCLLIDGGYGLLPLRPLAERVAAGRPIRALATHAHVDHIGALHEFDEVLCHRLEADILRAPTPATTQSLPFLRDEPVFAPGLTFVPAAEAFPLRPVAPRGMVEDGDTLDLGGRHLEVLHTPGHAPGALCLLERASGTLFTADTLLDGRLYDAIPGADPGLLRRSHARLRALPVRTVYPGHYVSFDGERMRALIDAYARASP